MDLASTVSYEIMKALKLDLLPFFKTGPQEASILYQNWMWDG